MKKSAEIIAVGTEILLGDIVNTNAQFIAEGLSQLGIDVYYQTVVGDNPQRLTDCLNLAKSRADIIITTGGLGPTYDDLTKETIAASFGRKLVMHQESLDQIVAFFREVNRPMTDNNKKQAMMPEGCMVLKNPNGTAPGCIIEGEDDKIAIMMPGPPSEMRPMFTDSVLPYLHKFSDAIIVSKNLRVIGVGESAIEDRLRPLMLASTNPTLAPYAKEGECVLRVTAKVHDRSQADALIDPMVEKIKGIFGEHVYGVDIPSMEYCVVNLLKEKGLKVGFAESCTGGLCAKRITDIPGASAVLDTSVVCYSNDSKMVHLGVSPKTIEQYGVISAKCAVEMAKGCLGISRADIAVGITGNAGPDPSDGKPVGLVYVAVTDGVRYLVRKLEYPRSRNYIRTVVSLQALDMVRRFALHPQPPMKNHWADET